MSFHLSIEWLLYLLWFTVALHCDWPATLMVHSQRHARPKPNRNLHKHQYFPLTGSANMQLLLVLIGSLLCDGVL